MNIIQLENLSSLDKQQLIHLIDEYYMSLGSICEALVDRSKCHCSGEAAFKRIEGALEVLNKYKLSDKQLTHRINWSLGKLTTEEWNKIRGIDNEQYNMF